MPCRWQCFKRPVSSIKNSIQLTIKYLLHATPAIIAALTAAISGFQKRRYFDYSTTLLWLYTCAAFIVEFTAIVAIIQFGNNMPLYGIYSLIEFGLLTAYFNYSVDVLRVKNVGLIIGFIGILFGVANIIFFQPLTVFNSYFLYFEGTVVICLSFVSFFRLFFLSDDLQLIRLRHFWFSFILCSFWTTTFLFWGLYDYLYKNKNEWAGLVNSTVNVISCVTYFAFATVFWRYPKLKQTDG